jgi:hypothetical protein
LLIAALKKSGIMYVILAESSVFGPNLGYGQSRAPLGARSARFFGFFKGFWTFWGPKPEKIAGPQGHAAQSWPTAL